MNVEDINNRFDFHPPNSPVRVEHHELVRAIVKHAALNLSAIVPDGREKALAITKLEEAMFWANAAIAREL